MTKNRFQKKTLLKLLFFKTLIIVLFVSGCKNRNQKDRPEIAVANSYLYSVINDICPNQTNIMTLVPPGMCPGHFDISPSQVNNLSSCKVLFIFDFQRNIVKAVPRLKSNGVQIFQISPSPGMCHPDTYLSILNQVNSGLENKKEIDEQRIDNIKKRISHLSVQVKKIIKKNNLIDTHVVVSTHQEEFVKWMGLKPVANFQGQDTVTPKKINQTLQETQNYNVKFVIANQQEGTMLAQAIAQRLNARLVVFSNFPNQKKSDNSIQSFDEMIMENITRLIEAANK